MSAHTPADLTITHRNLRFETKVPRWWLNNDPLASAIYSALSTTFPEGERKFIESVARYADQAREPLKSQITAFIRQEATHTREHLAFNAHVVEAGYDLSGIEARLKERMAEARQQSPLVQLAATAALEHFTAILAHQALADRSEFANLPEKTRQLWEWHAIEEIEHKAVAFDTLMMAAKDLTPFKRWLLRVLVMYNVTNHFVSSMIGHVADLLRQDGFEPKTFRWRAIRYLFGKPGVLRKVLPAYLAYYRPGFHPWEIDDRALMAQDVLPPDALPAAA